MERSSRPETRKDRHPACHEFVLLGIMRCPRVQQKRRQSHLVLNGPGTFVASFRGEIEI